jgi:NTE family protein
VSTTAFVLSGGGSLGAVQVGMLQALTERQLTPDLLVGTSVGAMNAAFLAGHGTGRPALDELAGIWASLRRRDIFAVQPVRSLLALAGRRDSVCGDHGIGRLITGGLSYPRLEDARIPLHVIAADLLTGEEALLSSGDAMSAVLASAAIPGVLPPVQRDGRTLIDGGLANNAAISHAVALGADRVFVLPTGYACALTETPAGPIAVALQALSLLIQQRLIADVARYADRVELVVLPPLCPLRISPFDFGHAPELVARAHAAAGSWLDTGAALLPHPERFLSLHRHRPGDPPVPHVADADGAAEFS